MKHFISWFYVVIMAFLMMACQNEDANATVPSGGNPTDTKTLIVYYSYTNNTKQIVDDLKSFIDADVIQVEPVNKNLDYAANNYVVGTEQLSKIKNNPNDESSYPEIDDVSVDLSKYNTVIIATPLWWSQMASNMQTFLFKYGKEMEGKNVGLIVSSHSSGISGVEADAKRLVPNCKFFAKSLWINASKHSQRKSLLEQWLKDIDYSNLTSNIMNTMYLKVNNNTMKVTLSDNAATRALVERLKEGVITYNAHDYSGFEKVGALGFSLPSADSYITTEPGDIMLYTGNQLCVFFDNNSWDYTPIGKIEEMNKQQLEDVFGDGDVSITLSLEEAAGLVSIFAKHEDIAKGIYTLKGHKLDKAPANGMYIENGVKKIKR
ncbi:MAG: hypothetical protein KBT32_05440 [Bacteroidales bacterium]|nr:hypothetical protein [Candidatus Physcocola equi]